MTTLALSPNAPPRDRMASRALAGAAQLWLLVAVIGQWVFFYYIARFYGPSTLSGNFHAWTRNSNLIKGYVAGDGAGNLMFGAHALLAGVIAFGGALQLVPYLRVRASALHRWNGRLFMVTALGVSISGLYLIWVRGSSPTLLGAFATSLNAVLIIAFVIQAWRSAVARDIAEHRRWALRAYLVANGQWFTRVGVYAVGILARPVIEPFFVIWGFGCTLVPLAVLELYLRTRDQSGPAGQWAMAGALGGLTALTAVGIFGYAMAIRPLLSGL
jgi:uncharacterized membrane protein